MRSTSRPMAMRGVVKRLNIRSQVREDVGILKSKVVQFKSKKQSNEQHLLHCTITMIARLHLQRDFAPPPKKTRESTFNVWSRKSDSTWYCTATSRIYRPADDFLIFVRCNNRSTNPNSSMHSFSREPSSIHSLFNGLTNTTVNGHVAQFYQQATDTIPCRTHKWQLIQQSMLSVLRKISQKKCAAFSIDLSTPSEKK